MTIHFSVDDFIDALLELKENYDSIFEQTTFAKLKKLHNTYGARFSLYCFYRNENGNLSQVTDKFAKEFSQNAHWLKFGFHGISKESNYGSRIFITNEYIDDYDKAKSDYKQVIDELIRITGGNECIDRVPRIHYYAGTEADCLAWKEAAFGITGLVSAEDSRICYYHSEDESKMLSENGIFQDKKRGLNFYRTSIRLENVTDKTELLNLLNENVGKEFFLIFTHEQFLERADILDYFAESADILLKKGYEFKDLF